MNDRHVRPSNTRAKRKSITSGTDGGNGWKFVNLSESPHAKDPELRKVVRVQAMLHYRRSQSHRRDRHIHKPMYGIIPPSPSKIPKYPSLAALEQSEEDCDHPWLQDGTFSWPSQWHELLSDAEVTRDSSSRPTTLEDLQQPALDNGESTLADSCSSSLIPYSGPALELSPFFLPRSGNSDPFNSFPIKDCPQNSELLYHFSSVLARNCLPIDRGNGTDNNPIRTIWMPLAMSDPVFFQATTSFAAVHLEMLHGTQNQALRLARKAQTIRMINERLECHEEALSNSTIGAIAMLAATEIHVLTRLQLHKRAEGQLKEMQIHESAIARMVRMRGGLKHLGCEVLHMFLVWGDLVTATIFGARPQLELCSPCSNFQHSPIYANMPTLIPVETGDFHDPLAIIYMQLRYLSAQMPLAGSTTRPFSDVDMLAFSEARSSIEHSLLCLSPLAPNAIKDKDEADIPQEDYIFEAHRLAALIYLNIVLRNCTPNGCALQSLKSQLKHTIRKAERPTACLGPRRRTALWAVFVGGLTSLNNEEETFFAGWIVKAMSYNDLQSWEEVEKALQEVAWADMLTCVVRKSLWPTVQGVRKRERPPKNTGRQPFGSDTYAALAVAREKWEYSFDPTNGIQHRRIDDLTA